MPSSPPMHRLSAIPLVLLVMTSVAASIRAEDLTVEVKRRTTDKAWKKYPTITLDQLRDFKPRDVTWSRFGGRTDRKSEATGFFRTEKLDDKWWIVDPEGFLWFSVGCCSVRTSPTARGKEALTKAFGSEAAWAQATTELLLTNGFNNLGCWSRAENFKDASPRLPYTTQSNFMSSYGKQRGGTYPQPGHTGYPNDCIFVFDPEFEGSCMQHAREKLGAIKNDPYCLGHFSDNEMPFRQDALDRYMSLDPDDPGRKAAEEWVKQNSVRKAGKKYTDKDRAAFLKYVASTYFSIVSKAIRHADPNHMYLGSRFHGSVLRQQAVVEGAGPHVDIVSFNWYGAWTPDAKRMDQWVEWAGKPFIITEWYAKGMDSGMSNVSGAGFTVKTQKDRGRFYQNFTIGLLKHPGCVGWHWFKYMDNDPTNQRADPSNQDSNKGLVNYLYQPWTDLLEAMRQINTQLYPLRDHLCKATD